jgi:hypothetical protein
MTGATKIYKLDWAKRSYSIEFQRSHRTGRIVPSRGDEGGLH